MKHAAARKHLHVLRAWERLPVAVPTTYRPAPVATRTNREIAAGEQARGDPDPERTAQDDFQIEQHLEKEHFDPGYGQDRDPFE